MEKALALADFQRWKLPQLRDYLRCRGLKTSGNKAELCALAFAASVENKPLVKSKSEIDLEKSKQYASLLILGNDGGTTLPDPFLLETGWVGEKDGMRKWPATMHMDIAQYLLTNFQGADLTQRLLKDYKEGKAYSYFDSKWLKELFYHDIKPSSPICFIKAKSTPSERLGNSPHNIWVAIEKKSGTVKSAYCTCFAGLGSTCNHVAAVLFKIDHAWRMGWTNQACTSLPCVWNRYGAKEKAVEIKPLHQLDWRKPHFSKQDKKTINPLARQLFIPTRRHRALRAPTLQDATNAMYASCKDASCFQYTSLSGSVNFSPDDDINVTGEEVVTTSPSLPPSLVSMALNVSDPDVFLRQLPLLSDAEAQVIEQATRTQSDNSSWFDQRRGRITASLVHDVMTKVRTLQGNSARSRDTSALVQRVLGYKVPAEDIPALKYGREMEPEARKSYVMEMRKKHSALSVTQCGLFVHKLHPYVGASPDGLVSCGCCQDGLLEIKCPLSIAHKDPKTVELDYLTCLTNNETCGDSLKKSHRYYSQVQFQMGITGRRWCDMFTFTKHGQRQVRVPFDQDRYDEELAAAKYFFEQHIVPELCQNSGKENQLPGSSVPPLTSPSVPPLTSPSVPPLTSPSVPPLTSPSVPPLASPSMPLLPAGSSLLSETSNNLSASLPRLEDLHITLQSTSKRRQRKRKYHKLLMPLYSCGHCNLPCEDNISDQSDNSVQCERCLLWFHWKCVGFIDTADEWFCCNCKN